MKIQILKLIYWNLIKNLKLKIKNYSSKSYKLKATSYQGFTLIELLIYISILAVVLAFTGEYLYSIGQARIGNNARLEVAQGGQLIINKLKSDLSQTSSVIIPADSNPSANLDLILSAGQTVKYSLASNDILRAYDTEVFALTSNQAQASGLSFRKITNSGGKETIQIQFRLESTAQMSGGRIVSEDFQTTVSRR